MATILPQNLKVFNLCCLKRQGPTEWLKNWDFLKKIGSTEEEFKKLKSTDGAFETKLRNLEDLYKNLRKLRDNWHNLIIKEQTGGICDKNTLQRNLELYNRFFDFWLKTRDERTDYNKHFLSLLFISTLVAILTPLLTTTA